MTDATFKEGLVEAKARKAPFSRKTVLAVGGASLAALWPAYRAAQLRPVEALTHT